MLRKSKKQPLNLSYDNLIIGSSLEAVLFSHQTKTPILFTRFERPYYFEQIEDFGLGSNKLDIWNKYIFLLSLSGLVPFSDKINHIRYLDSTSLKVVTKEDKLCIIKFNRLFVFDDESFYDLPAHTGVSSNENIVVDWLKVKTSKYHELDYIDRDNKFMNRIIFHPVSKAFLGKYKKDGISVSYLTDSQIYSEKYADYVVKIKSEGIMKDLIKDPKLSIEHLKRDIIKLGRNIYTDFDNVMFMYIEPKSAWEFTYPKTKINYIKYIKSKLGM